MHLNCALVPSFLFVSAVLAGNHPEKQQPPFLDPVKKSINTTDLGLNDFWGGALRKAQWQGEIIDYASGTFAVPSIILGYPGSEYDIAVVLSGFTPCLHSTLGVGINVKLTADGRVSYEAWARWARDNIMSNEKFHISAQHMITAVVGMITPTSGIFILINHTAGPQVWAAYIYGQPTGCNQDAAWVVSAHLAQPLSFPNFGVVAFTHIRAGISGIRGVPNIIHTIDIDLEDGRPATYTSVFEDYVNIHYVLR